MIGSTRKQATPNDRPSRADVKVRVAVNGEIVGKINFCGKDAESKRGRKSLTFNYRVSDLTYQELAEAIQARKNITSICVNSSGRFHRAEEHFKSIDVVGLDFDKNIVSFAQALMHQFIVQSCLLAYTTAQHTPEWNRYRFFFHLAERITDPKQARRIILALMWYFREWKPDESCKEPNRFYYGSGEDGQVILLGNRLTSEVTEMLLDEYAEATTPKRQSRVHIESTPIYFSEDVQQRRRQYGERAIETAVRMIDTSEPPNGSIPGNRHIARRSASRLLGGYIAGGMLDYSTAHAALSNAVSRNTDNYQKAMQTIESGLIVGQAAPITFEELERDREEWLKSRPAPRPQPKRTPEEIRERAEKIRAKISPEARAYEVVGAKAAKAMARLWAACELSAESRDLLFVLHAMATTDNFSDGSELEFLYAQLFPYLFRADGYYKEGKLTSAGSKKIRERFQKLEAEQKKCRITFAHLTPGHKDGDGNLIDSHVRLFSQSYIAEIEAKAESEQGFARHRNYSRERATIAWVKEQAGAAYIERTPKYKTQNQRISDGLGRVKGNLNSTIQRMRQRRDDETRIWLALCEILPRGFLDFVIKNGDLIYRKIQVTFDSDPVVIDDDFPHTEDEPTPQKLVTSEEGLNRTDSTGGSAQNSDFVQSPDTEL